MTDQEFQTAVLQALQKQDQKLESFRAELKSEMQELKNELKSEFKSEMQELRTELKGDIHELKSDFQQLKTEFKEVRIEFKNDMQELKAEFKSDTQGLRNDLSRRLDRLEDNQNNDRKLLMDIWESREKVIAQVTWDFMWKAVSVNAVLLLIMLIVLKI